MLNKVNNREDIDKILEYLGKDYKTTPYLYINVIKYGLGTDNVFTWIDKNENDIIEAVYLLYYDCIHFFTKNVDSYPVDRLLQFIRSTPHRVIMVPGEIGNRIEDFLPDHYSERNCVIDMDEVGLETKEYKSEIASRDDIDEIVDLLMADPLYKSVYNREVLIKQSYDRFDDNFSRYFVVRMDGKVVSTCSTFGEVPGFALIGGVIVHPEYRRRGLAADVENFTCKVLADEGVSRVGLVNYNNKPSLELHEKLGAKNIATIAKFVNKQ